MNRLTVAYTGALLMLALGCKDLNLGPKDQVSDASFWKTPDQFRLAANDFYFALRGPNYVELNSDIATGSGSAEMSSMSNGSYLPAANSDLWNNSYVGIRATNYLLQKAQESGLGSQVDRWVGEALFFRAYNYWNLVKAYGGVPLITKALDVSSPDVYTPRSTQQEIIDFIIADLDNAVAKLPKQSELTGDEMGRVTQGAALALKARAALYQGTWLKYHAEGSPTAMLADAIAAAEQLVASTEYQLYTDSGPTKSYKYLFILAGDDSKEVILARRYFAGRATHNWTRELWFNFMIPTKKLADMYLATDGLPITSSPLFKGYDSLRTEFDNRDPRMAMTFVVPGDSVFQENGFQPVFPGFSGSNATRTGYMLRKFLDESVEATHFNGEYDFKEFRYGEVLLNLAEALFERDGQISDVDLGRTIDSLRARVGMPALTNGFVAANGLDMLTEIRRERTLELAFEGFRRDDLRRWKTAETDMPQALRGVKFEGTEYETRYPGLVIGTDIQVDAGGFIVAEPSSARQFLPKHYLDPIPLQQIQLSKGTLTQNPGW